MSWGRGVSNEGEALKHNQRLALGPGLAAATIQEQKDHEFSGISLRVVQHPDPQITLLSTNENHNYSYDPCVYLNPTDIQTFQDDDDNNTNTLFIHVRQFPKMVVKVVPHEELPSGHIYMSEMTASNLEVTNRDVFSFRKYIEIPPNLRMVHVEVRPRDTSTSITTTIIPSSSEDDNNDEATTTTTTTTTTPSLPPSTVITIDANTIRDLLISTLFNTVVTQYERLLLPLPNTPHELICTVSETRLDSWQDIDSLPTLVSKSKSDAGAM